MMANMKQNDVLMEAASQFRMVAGPDEFYDILKRTIFARIYLLTY